MAIQTRLIEYDCDGTLLEGYLAWDDSAGPAPAVAVSHTWAGRGAFEESKARALAEQGYVGFAIDMYGKGILGTTVEENTALMTPLVEDRALLQTLADQARSGADPGAVPLEALQPDARALYALLSNQDPERVAALIDQLSPRIRAELYGIDPASQDLSQLHAHAILVHGRGDTMIPYTESVALAAALPAEQVQLFLIDGFAHVDVQPQRHQPRLRRYRVKAR